MADLTDRYNLMDREDLEAWAREMERAIASLIDRVRMLESAPKNDLTPPPDACPRRPSRRGETNDERA